MIELLKRFFNPAALDQGLTSELDPQRIVTVAVCALFLEMGSIDDNFSTDEMAHVLSVLTGNYGLSTDTAEAMLAEAEHELDTSVDLWQFARVINENYSVLDKERLIEQLWQIVYVDGKMDPYEHYLMNKLSNLLRLSHKQLIDAKLKVLKRQN
ncbi:MAG: hypothetical protein CSA23_00560 [Deltaproteobacteria bacterium]|nr:MAG: hypothetical protein CSA23_00560 [Deltaproteobacteria bacterium]